jgi:polar amino acid transport system substrate-binding protein
MTASKASGITTLDGLAGKSICAGEATTYLDWLSGKKLDFGTLSPTTSPPAGIKVVSLKTDALCPQTWGSGRNDFQGWLSATPIVDGAIKQGLPVVKVGDPVYFEPLAIAVDKRDCRYRLRCRADEDRQRHAFRRNADGHVHEVVRADRRRAVAFA